MLIEFQEYLTFENVYLWVNFAILPFWLMLIFLPNIKITQILLNSIILPLILSATYVYVIYQSILVDNSIVNILKLYTGIDNLYIAFEEKSLLLVFWLHFLAINIFLGTWVSRDAIKYNIPRKITFIPLILIYFSGPLGLVLYWLFRVFYARRLGFHD